MELASGCECGPPSQDSPNFLGVSPGWLNTMRIPILGGRDFRPEETYPHVALVNQAFAKRYFRASTVTATGDFGCGAGAAC
jgi:hypothetical protein